MFTIQKTDIFDKWFSKLKDFNGKGLILAQIKRVEIGNLGDYKALGKGLFELRIDVGPGYWLYFTRIQTTPFLSMVLKNQRNIKRGLPPN